MRGRYPALKLQPMGDAAPSGTLLFKCDKMTVVIMLMDVPIPSGWEPIADRISPQWPEAVAVISRHQQDVGWLQRSGTHRFFQNKLQAA